MRRAMWMLIGVMACLPACLESGASDDDDDDDDEETSSNDDGSDGSDGDGVRASWQDAISGYQFTYYYNVSDYSERISFIFCGSGDVSYSWSINSGGTTGTGSDSGGEDGTWELGETTGSAARIELDGDESGRVDLIMTVDSGGNFYIDDARYYREWYGC